jgi:FAD dependent oxidoreductase
MFFKGSVKEFEKCSLETEVCVVGGGTAGICAAVAAARNGAKVILVQDRPMLGGNASSEIRMWICGAHGKGNQESGLVEELQLNNYYYNPTRIFPVWDDVMYGFCVQEPNLTLILNCSINQVVTEGSRITEIKGWSLTEQKNYSIKANIFADCSGDSVLRTSGAEYRIGREGRDEFNECHAPEKADSMTMGNSILIQLREIDPADHKPFRAPEWAHHYTDETAPKRPLDPVGGSNFWWLEIGGIRDTIGQSEEIRDDLLKIAYGCWEYIKNHPDGRGHSWDLDWIGSLPGKRENVRYVGDHILNQNDVEAEGRFEDIIAHGGWSMDDHHPLAIEHPGEPTIFHHAPSPYGIPYRALYSKNIENLMFAGRNMSATHMAMSSTRVMATTSVMGQAVGTAASIAVSNGLTPRGVYEQKLAELQKTLLDQDQFIPWKEREVPALTLEADASHEVLRNGIERDRDDNDNGIWLADGESVEYSFSSSCVISCIRLIFDSDLSDKKHMICRVPKEGNEITLPEMLTKGFEIQAQNGGEWRTVYTDDNNFHRLVILEIAPFEAEAVRLKINSTWGDSKAHVYSFEISSEPLTSTQ